MTGHDETNDVHALSGAYAVDALDNEERVRFEEHLRGCPTCRTEVAELRDTAALLAGGADADPPPALRDRVLAGIESVRPLPPLAPLAAPADAGPGAPPRPTSLEGRRPRFRLRGSHLLAAAAVVVLLAAAGLAAWRPWSEPDLTAAERVLAAEDAVRTTERMPDGARATVVVSRSEGSAVIITEDLPLAPEGKVYELWLATPEGTLEPAGLMPDERDATVLLDGDATEATGVGVTVEPDGGSPQPTTEPIAFFEVEQG